MTTIAVENPATGEVISERAGGRRRGARRDGEPSASRPGRPGTSSASQAAPRSCGAPSAGCSTTASA